MRFPRFLVLAASAIATAGCSTPIPPVADSAWQAAFPGTGAKCTTANHDDAVGAVNATTKSTVVANGAGGVGGGSGTGGAQVSCSVVGVGSAFDVNGTSFQNDQALVIAVNGITTSATQANPVKGEVSLADSTTAGNAYTTQSGEQCNFYFAANTPEGVDVGRIWVAFQCPALTSMLSTCENTTGYAIFENCDETAPSM